jgi:hypothetical protein
MPTANSHLSIRGRSVVVRFGAFGVYTLERVTETSVWAFSEKVFARKEASYEDFTHLLFAGLEGYRVWSRDPRAPWTLEEVCTLVDDVSEWSPLLPPLYDALASAIFKEAAKPAPGAEGADVPGKA